MPPQPEPMTQGNEFHNLGRGVCGHHNDACSFFLTCVGVEKKINENLAFFAYVAPPVTPWGW